jgi:c-di-GMP phosphodiesterase
MQKFLIGRQPVFDRQQHVVGYELLHRSYTTENWSLDGDRATHQVILNTFSEIGFDNLVSKGVAFINTTRSFLTGKLPIPFPPNRVVLEVLEDIIIDPQLIKALQTLKEQGFIIALDDITSYERIKPCLKMIKIVKIDLPRLENFSLPVLVKQIHQHGILVLAEKVETLNQYEYCHSIGFDYFQGYYLCKPNIIKGTRIDSSRMVILHALALLQDPDIDFKSLEKVISRDASLSYKLLKLVNSAYYSRATQINSLTQTMALIGITQLRSWLTLLLISSVKNKPHELTLIAMARAKLCELLAKSLGIRETEIYFMVGLFSILDALLDQTMEQILSNVSVTTEVTGALLKHEGKTGSVLDNAIALERGEWDKVAQIELTSEEIRSAYIQSIEWASSITNSIDNALID